jgi:hypothetical protein
MAKLYGLNNAVDFAAKNLINFTSIFARSAGQPLDKTAIWYPAHVDAEWNVVAADAEGAVYKTGYERAAQYAATSAAYVGQELAVIDVTYAEDGTTVTGSTVTIYCIQDNAGTLQEVGKATSGDGKSITLSDDGILSISGFEAAQGATLPQKQADGTIKWVAIDTIVQGDGNTKTVVAPTEGETHVIVDLVRDPDTDTNTYTISLKLDDYATAAAVGTAITEAKEELAEAIADVKEELEGTIADVEDKFDEAIGVAASEGVEASGLYAAIAAAEERAKAYADAGDDDTVYDDTEVKGLISGHATRIGALETALGDETQGLIKGLADEVSAREQGDTTTLNSAKGYTDEQITGLDIVIEKKTVENVESDYIVIKNKAGTEVASVNAAKFVKDGMLESAVYSTSTKKLVLTWNTDAGKSATEIDLNDLVNTYTGSDHIIVGTDGKISVADDVALESDLTALETAFEKAIKDEAKARDDADKAIGERIDGVVADVALKAVKTDVETALAAKADKSALDTHVEAYGEFVESYTTDKSTFATKTDLDNKVDTTTYNNDKATFATKSDVNGQFTAVGQRIDLIEEAVGKEAEGETAATGLYKKIEDLGTDVATNYATKTEVAGVEEKADSNTNLITNLTGRLDGIVAQGGEPNTINTIKVNGVAQAITDKSVDIAVPVISDVKIANLNDGTALVNRVATTEADIKAINTAVSGNQTGIASLTNRIGALEKEVKIEGESRIDALETTVNGVEGVSDGLVGKVATHTTEIAGLKTKDTELASLIQGNTDRFNDYYTKTAVDGLLKTVDLSSRLETSVFDAYKTSQAELVATLATKSEVKAVSTEVAKKANAADVYDKTTADSTFVKDADFNDKVDARVNTLIDGANSEDTIKNVTNLVAFVNENAGDIAQLITDVEANTSAIAANKAAHEKNASAIGTLVTTVNAQKVVESTEISTSATANGIELGIKSVNVNKLVQTTGDVLILNGGSASV